MTMVSGCQRTIDVSTLGSRLSLIPRLGIAHVHYSRDVVAPFLYISGGNCQLVYQHYLLVGTLKGSRGLIHYYFLSGT